MKFVPNVVSRKVGRQILLTQKNAPSYLFVAGTVGVVAAGIMACRATLKVDDVLQDHAHKMARVDQERRRRRLNLLNYTEADAVKDRYLAYLQLSGRMIKLYGPAVVIGLAGIACFGKSNNILQKRNAALMAAYTAVQKAFEAYRERVVNELGEEKDREFQYGVISREVYNDETQQVETIKSYSPDGVSQYARFFDEMCQPWKKTPEYNLVYLQIQQRFANQRLQSRGHVFLNEVYEALDIPHSQAGSVVGWVLDGTGDKYIDFGLYNSTNPKARDFVNGREGAILLDFNVDGVIWDKIKEIR